MAATARRQPPQSRQGFVGSHRKAAATAPHQKVASLPLSALALCTEIGGRRSSHRSVGSHRKGGSHRRSAGTEWSAATARAAATERSAQTVRTRFSRSPISGFSSHWFYAQVSFAPDGGRHRDGRPQPQAAGTEMVGPTWAVQRSVSRGTGGRQAPKGRPPPTVRRDGRQPPEGRQPPPRAAATERSAATARSGSHRDGRQPPKVVRLSWTRNVGLGRHPSLGASSELFVQGLPSAVCRQGNL